MKKPSLSLDFSEISGGNKVEEKPKEANNASGIEILIQGEECLRAIDLAHATHQEFIDWCCMVYPGIELKQEHVDTTQKKIIIFNRIVTIGGCQMFSRKRPDQMVS